MNKNEPNALKRRTRVFMYEDDGVTPGSIGTSPNKSSTVFYAAFGSASQFTYICAPGY